MESVLPYTPITYVPAIVLVMLKPLKFDLVICSGYPLDFYETQSNLVNVGLVSIPYVTYKVGSVSNKPVRCIYILTSY